MHLGDWLAQQPRGAKQRLARLTGLWPNTITDIARRKRAPEYETARLISTATDGAVTVDEIMQPTPTKAARKRARRRHARRLKNASDRPNDDARD
jgi:transcriptional regulator with XRE-family HTH domain